jgi:hypothetical protein
MTCIVEGVYKHGKIELLESPPGLPDGPVRVIIIPQADQPKPPACLLTFGKYPGDASTLEDFKEAQWRGEKKWDQGDGR